MYYVYAYLRSKDSSNGGIGSPYYIGKGKGKRAYRVRSSGGIRPPRDKSLIVILQDALIEQQALMLEKKVIEFYGRLDTKSGPLRNHTEGGQGISGFRWKRGSLSPEHIEKLKVSFRKRRPHPQTPETREKIRQPLTGGTRSLECREKISRAKLGKHCSPKTEFKKGQRQSQEFYARLSASLKGRTNNPNGLLGRKHTVESRAKMSVALRAAWARRKATP